MHNNYHFLRKLALELNQLWNGSVLEVCFSQEKDELVLGFSNDYYLKSVLKPEFSVLTVVQDFSRARRNSVTLYDEWVGAAVQKIEVFSYERAIGIYLDNQVVLVIKLFGNRPNLLIYQNDVQVAMFNNRLLTDKEIELNTFERNLDLSFEKFVSLNADFKKQFVTLGKENINYLNDKLEVLLLLEKWQLIQEFWTYLENPKLYIRYSNGIPSLSFIEGEQQESAIKAINNFAAAYQKVSATDRLKFDLENKLQKELNKTNAYIRNVEAKLNDLKNGIKNEELGNILMANLHAIEDGVDNVELLNFYTDSSIIIKLKKDLSPQKNAEAYYRKSKNEKIELETLESNLNAALERAIQLEEELDSVKKSDELKTLKGISKSYQQAEKNAAREELPFKEYFYKNTKIWVGRNAKNNDLLLTKYAHKDEWWLHARDTGGSHVVIKSFNPGNDVLEYAASLAAYYSKRKNENLVTVIYTQKKFVRKAKNLPAGKVIIEKEKTLLVEPARL